MSAKEPSTSICTAGSYIDKSKLEEVKKSCTYFAEILDKHGQDSTEGTESQSDTQFLQSNRDHTSEEIGPEGMKHFKRGSS